MTTVTRPDEATRTQNIPAQEPTIGQAVPRLDGLAKATGTAHYTVDRSLPDMLYGVVIGATIARGHVQAVDHAAIAQLPGVLLVLSAQNCPPTPPRAGETDPFVWFDPAIMYDGQPVAFVVATTQHQAEAAARALPIAYESLAPVATLHDALAEGAPTIGKQSNIEDPGKGEYGTKMFDANYQRGDVEAGLAAATIRLEALYAIATQVHTPWETFATLAHWDGATMTVYESTQSPHSVQRRIAQSLGVSDDHVRVITEYVGGGFGAKFEGLANSSLAAFAARELRRPVRSTLSREQAFRMAKVRPATEMQIRAGVDAAGNLLALDNTCYMAAPPGDDYYDYGAMSSRFLYACPNVRSQHRLVRVNFNPGTSMRGPSLFQAQFALETAMDELAHQLHIDPIAFRERHHTAVNPMTGKPYSSDTMLECIERGAKLIGWEQHADWDDRRATSGGAIVKGLGMAVAFWPTFRGSSQAEVRIDAAGKVAVLTSSVDIGTGQYTILAQVAADALGVDLADVVVKLGDTTYPRGIAAGGSMGAAASSNAVHQTALSARQALLDAALAHPSGRFAGRSVSDLATAHGNVIASDAAGIALSFAEVARAAGGLITVAETYKPAKSAYELADYGAHFAEVEVDRETGMVRVTRFVAVHDSGRVLNAHTFRSQLAGGIIWGISAALFEEVKVDHRTARALNAGLAEYHIPTAMDIGEIIIDWLDTPDTAANPLGVKGVGEVGITGVAPAIGNAIFNATGVRLRSMPFTPRRLLNGLHALEIPQGSA